MNPNPSEILASTRSVAHLLCPKLPFLHAGVTRTLNKHPKVQQALRVGTISPQQALLAPWYLRAEIGGKERLYKLAVKDADALRAAKDILNGRLDSPTMWAQFQAAQNAKQSITLGQLAQLWTAAGCPFSKTKSRPPEAADRIQATMSRALDFWHSVPAGTVNHGKLEDFVVWRRKHVRVGARFTGSRSADLELAALSSLCQWAIHTGQIEKNPFENREIYTTNVQHCHEKMCDNDEQLHQLLAWFWNRPTEANGGHHEAITAGAWIALSHLTGLRPGEPEFLKFVAPLEKFPSSFDSAAAGQIYPMPDGTQRMKVHRLKRGQNPQILLTPALQAFLDVWTTWLKCHGFQYGDKLIPIISQDRVSDLLDQACLEIYNAGDQRPRLTPHGGRAYYVRVRRGQGADDAVIAQELGQSSNGKLIRSTYGDPKDPVGGNLHDWLPSQGEPAWTHLKRHYALVRRDTL